jgi:hypothetical protein
MKKLIITMLLSVSTICFAAQPKDAVKVLKLGDRAEYTTAPGLKLPSAFGDPAQNFLVVRITGLKKAVKYQAAFSWEGNTGINYGMTWVDGNPFVKDWRNLGGIGSGTGTGEELRPGYDTYQLFTTDPKSKKSVIYLVIRSDKPWTISLSVSPAAAGISRETKNSYGYYAVDDWTNGDTVTFELTRN